jgi:hypothetical protein
MAKPRTALFGIKSHFQFSGRNEPENEVVFEERLVVFRAASHEAALCMGFSEANRYAAETGSRFLERVDSYEIDGTRLKFGMELYSELRGTQINNDSEYLKTFFPGHKIL